MSKATLFQYAVLWHPTEKQEKDGQKSKILVDPKYILAKDQKSIALSAAMELSAEYKDQLDQIDIIVRPF